MGLTVALGDGGNQEAVGSLFWDDGESFGILRTSYILQWENNTLDIVILSLCKLWIYF